MNLFENYDRKSRWTMALYTAAGVAALSVASLQASGASAQSTLEGVVVTGQQSSGLKLTDPSSGSRLGISNLDSPSTIQVLTGDLIRERGVTSLYQAETQAPGVTSQSTPGNGLGGLGYRGFVGVGSVQTLYDGLQLTVAAGTTTFPFDAWNVDRVEVLGGPNSVLYGFGGIGGTVNIIPRKPNTKMMSNEVQLEGGSFNTWRQALDSTGPINDKLSYRFDIAHQTSSGYVDRGHSRSLAASGVLQYDASPTLRFTLREDYGNIEPMNYWGTPLINGVFVHAIRRNNYEVQDDPIRFLDNYVQFKTEWQAADNISIVNTVYNMKAYRHWRQLTNYNFTPATGLINRTSYREVFHHENQDGDQFNATIHGNLGGLKNDLSVGAEYQNISFITATNTPFAGTSNVDPYNPVPGPFLYGVGTFNQYHSSTNQYSVFGEDRLVLSEKVSLVAGARYDDFSYHYADLTTGTPVYDKGFNFLRDYRPFAWRVGAVYNPIKTVTLYAQYATGQDAVGNLVSTTYAQRDFTLASGRQFEVGVKQTFWGDRGQYTLAAYQITKKNILAPDPNNPTVSIQIGQQSSRGVEGSLALELMHGVGVQANGALTDAHFDQFTELVNGVLVSRAGNLPPFVANSSANLFGTWDIDMHWQVRAGIQYVGKRFANNPNTFILPSYAIGNIGVRWTPIRKLSIDARIDNISNKDYAMTGVSGFSQYILGPPRAFYVTANYAF